MFRELHLGSLALSSCFVLPQVKLAYGASALLISEPVAVTQEGKEHPRQLCVHLPASGAAGGNCRAW
jgi:hypothetical protein